MSKSILNHASILRASLLLAGLATLTSPCLADVCQKDGGDFRIKAVRKKTTDRYEFQICYKSEKKCRPLGDKTAYSWEALAEVRSRELSASYLPSNSNRSAALGIFGALIFGLGQIDPDAVRLSAAAQDGTISAGTPPTPEQRANATEHKENAEVLASEYLSTDKTCANVDSIERYKETLLRVLQFVPGFVLEDGRVIKVYPAMRERVVYHTNLPKQAAE